MRTFKALSLALVVLMTSVGASGCLVRTRGTMAYTVYSDPPPPRRVYVSARPGYVWVDGYWYWAGSDWVWADGYYIEDRPGYVWVQGTWVGRSWRPGYWNTRGTTYVTGRSGGRGTVYVQGRGAVRTRGTVRGGARIQGGGHYDRHDRHDRGGSRDHR